MPDPVPLKTEKSPRAVATVRCPNMIAVASGKGGVGKTWLSITLCHALAKRGQTVLLFDGDFGLANVDIQLGLTPDKDLAHVIDGAATLKDAITPFRDGGFDVLAGRSGSGGLATLAAPKLVGLRNDLITLAQDYDRVIVDLGAGVDRAVRQMAGPAAVTCIVVTDEPTSLTDAYAFIKLAYAATPDADLRVVVNMAATTQDGQKTFETLRKVCATYLRTTPRLAGIIRRDPRVRDAIRAQTPLLTRSPSSEAATDIDAVATQLVAKG